MSGGGHRACLFALGATMYLADADRTKQITSVSSVSGGSLANGALGQDLDLTTCSAEDVEATAARVARRVIGRGTPLGQRVTWLYALVLVLLLAAVVATWWLPIAIGCRIGAFVVALLVFAWVFARRGWVTARAFGNALYNRDGKRPRLTDLHTAVDHVICATDLHAGEHVYFSGRFVYAYRFGVGVPGDLRLETAVQASAAFPGVFPAAWVGTGRFRFEGGQPKAAGTRTLALHDGGVYDNMGDQWAHGLGERVKRLGDLNPGFGDADELIVISASAGLEFGPVWTLRLPLLGGLMTLLRDKSVLYDNGNSVRRRELVARFDLAEREGKGLRGCLVHIPQSPFKVPDAFAGAGAEWPERAERSRSALAALAGEDEKSARKHWEEVADRSATVPTTLAGFDRERTAELLHHAYVLTMINLHVVLGYPLLQVPGRERFDALVA
jgi:predicted acylesterase/phospholipase RssA